MHEDLQVTHERAIGRPAGELDPLVRLGRVGHAAHTFVEAHAASVLDVEANDAGEGKKKSCDS